jgi:hypothetical protein
MYEQPRVGETATHDELYRRDVAQGSVDPLMIGDVDLGERTVATGVPLGYLERPRDAGWIRLRRGDLAARQAVSLSNQEFPPSAY